MKRYPSHLIPLAVLAMATLYSCAKMGRPDGGWFDETPPRVIGAQPADGETGVWEKKVTIFFDEYIKLENATEKVVISPPQIEPPEIKASGRRIIVELNDSLMDNTTYTIDFSDAISDNNEGNPLGNYTYTFSTGSVIDTMEVSGYVIDASNLEPIKGILVGLYSNLADSAFTTQPMLRVSRTDSRGRFTIKGIAPGEYRAYALQDLDNNYYFTQKAEQMAFSHDVFSPSSKPDIRQDTIWRDSLHIERIERVGYTHFLPDDIVLRAFTETLTDRYLLKSDRNDPNRLNFYFSYGDEEFPHIEPLNFDASNALLVESNFKRDSVTYWLQDTLLVNQDTLSFSLTYHVTDSLGQLIQHTDTLNLFPKMSYERRMKEKNKEYEKWHKEQEKRKKRGRSFQEVMPVKPLNPEWMMSSTIDPDQRILLRFPTPLSIADTTAVHLYEKVDTAWNEIPVAMRPSQSPSVTNHGEVKRFWEFLRPDSAWMVGREYSLEIDSAAFVDIYGLSSNAMKKGFKTVGEEETTTIVVNIADGNGTMVAQLLNKSDKVVKEVRCDNATAEFLYVRPGEYYLRLFEDANDNGQWDTGEYASDLQPENMYYFPEVIECKAKRDVTKQWFTKAWPLYRQKPSEITKQKPDKEKKVKSQNAERARKLGIPYIIPLR